MVSQLIMCLQKNKLKAQTKVNAYLHHAASVALCASWLWKYGTTSFWRNNNFFLNEFIWKMFFFFFYESFGIKQLQVVSEF